jgi:hypothetical protein
MHSCTITKFSSNMVLECECGGDRCKVLDLICLSPSFLSPIITVVRVRRDLIHSKGLLRGRVVGTDDA